jgi:putative molybdopterin biosynthesis protein
MPQSILTLKEVSALLRVHPSHIYRLLKRRQIPAMRIGGSWRFDYRVLIRWIESRTAKVKA